MLFFIVINLIACSEPPPNLKGYDKNEFHNNWWQLEVDNELIKDQLSNNYGYPPCFILETERKLAFIISKDHESYWTYSYKKIDTDTYLLDNNLKINVSRIDTQEVAWYLKLKQNFFEYDGYAYECKHIPKNIRTSDLE
tara:strand:+ start:1272 stop:1688 length:417 start_codon:yes stop_codon:yes gene_type:complete